LVKKGHDAIIPHEQVHIEQQKRIGLVKYIFKYLIFPDFRYWAEYEAYRKGSGLSIGDAEDMSEKYRDSIIPFSKHSNRRKPK
jgi:hypothetical protein